MEVIVEHGDHGVIVYATALACLESRLEDSSYYFETEEEIAEAQKVLDLGDERHALSFLIYVSNGEYDSIELVPVIGELK